MSSSQKSNTEAIPFSPNNGTSLRVSVPDQFKILGHGYGIEHIEHGASLGTVTHSAVN